MYWEDYERKFKDVNTYWGEKMPMMACEEFAELIQAVSKCERYGIREDVSDNLKKEMADAIISIGALCVRYGIDVDDVEARINQKLRKEYRQTDSDWLKEHGVDCACHNIIMRSKLELTVFANLSEKELLKLPNVGKKKVEDLKRVQEMILKEMR